MVLQDTSPTPPNRLVKLWQFLTTPHPSVAGEERQKTSVLMALLVVFIPLAALSVFNTSIIALFNRTGNVSPNSSAVIALIFVFIAYPLSRTRYHQIAGYLVVFMPILAVTAITLTGLTPPSPIALFFLTLSVILSGLLLNAKTTVIVGVIAVLISITAYFMPIANPIPIVWSIPLFIAITTGVMAVVSNINGGYVLTLEKTQQSLKEQYEIADKARERAEKSDQVKSAFLASMSHELRTPLNAIINFTKFVSNGTVGSVNSEQEEMLNEVIDSGKHLLNLINDVLDMSKIEAGSLTLFVEDNVDLRAILTSSINTGKALAKDKPLRFDVQIADDLPVLRADRQRILQAMLNVLSNAVKFTEAGSVKIVAARNGDDVLLEVIDTGPGIAPEDQAGVFEAFKQTKTGLRLAGGTGLGMPITKSLVEAHGGRLWLTSEAGKGATFHIRLPIKSDTLVPMTHN